MVDSANTAENPSKAGTNDLQFDEQRSVGNQSEETQGQKNDRDAVVPNGNPDGDTQSKEDVEKAKGDDPGITNGNDRIETNKRGEVINNNETEGISAPGANGSGSSNWNPANTKVFDVYMDNGSSQTSQLLDIFACESSQKQDAAGGIKRKAEDDGLELHNSGTGERPQGLLEKMNEKKFKHNNAGNGDRKPFNSLTLPMVKLDSPQQGIPRGIPQSTHVSYPLPNGIPHSAPVHSEQLTSFGQTDKWPSKMENAFIAALRIIIKNGTSKFKILEKNYGRNELISLFVQYHTGEVRTKKQISSHIQVWKKSISNKISSNFKVNPLDEEILQLIEEGAPQTNESIKLFYSCFEEIVSNLSKQSQTIPSRHPGARDSMHHYPYLISPAQSATNSVVPFSQNDALQQQQQQQQISQPETPLDYAKSIYGSLKTYKCVPVKVQDQMALHQDIQHQQPPPQHSSLQSQPADRSQQQPQPIYVNPPQKPYPVPNPILQSAKDLAYQQRQLIENLSQSHNQFKLPSVSPNLYVRNLQPPSISPPQQNIYQNNSQPLVSGSISHYPAPYPQIQPNREQVPAGLVLPPHKYYQQPQIYVPVSAPPSNNSGSNTGYEPNHSPLKEMAQQQLQPPTADSYAATASNQTTNHKGRDSYQLTGQKN